jgi:hypothetical protein
MMAMFSFVLSFAFMPPLISVAVPNAWWLMCCSLEVKREQYVPLYVSIKSRNSSTPLSPFVPEGGHAHC